MVGVPSTSKRARVFPVFWRFASDIVAVTCRVWTVPLRTGERTDPHASRESNIFCGRTCCARRRARRRHGAAPPVQCSGKTKYTMSSLRNTQVPILKTESPVKDVRNSLLPFYHPHTPGSRDRDAVSPRSLLVDALLLRTLLSGRSQQPPHSPSNQAHRTSPIHPERQHVHSGVH